MVIPKVGDQTIGIMVRYLRMKKKLKGEDLGHLVGYSKSWVSILENNKLDAPIDPHILDQLAKHLDTTVEIMTCKVAHLNEKLLALDGLLRARNLTDETRRLADALVDSVKEGGDGPRYKVVSLVKRGNIEYLLGDYELAICYYDEALPVAIGAKDYQWVHNIQQNLADCLLGMADYPKAEETILKNVNNLDAWVGLIEKASKAKNYKILGSIYFQTEQVWKSEEYIRKALEMLDESDAIRIRSECLQILGTIQLVTGDVEAAIETSIKAFRAASLCKHSLCQVYSARTTGSAFLELGDLVEARGHYAIAIQLLPPARDLEHLELNYLVAQCNPAGDEAYEEMKVLLNSLEEKQIPPRTMSKFHEQAGDLAYRLGMYNESATHYKKAIQKHRIILK